MTYPGGGSDSFAYNGSGARVTSSGTNGSKTFRRNGIGVTSPLMSDGASQYTPGASVRTGSTSKFQHNGLKNTTDQTSSSQTVMASRHYDAFGKLLSSSGTWIGPFGYAGSFGYQEDGNGLKLLGHRYYDSDTGRFLTQDPIKDGKNWYVYCEGSPVIAYDPTGLQQATPGIARKKFVMIVGETNNWYEEGVMGMVLKHVIANLDHNGYDVILVYNPYRDEALRDLKDADGIGFMDHGSNDRGTDLHGTAQYHEKVINDSWIPNEAFKTDLMKMRNDRDLDLVWYLTCYGWHQRTLWSPVSGEFRGYKGGLNQWSWYFWRSMDKKKK